MNYMEYINAMSGLSNGINRIECRENNLKGFYTESYVSDGARFKCWVMDRNNIKFLYKENKIHPTGEYTKENYSEYISMLIARQISVPCVDIILKDNAILSRVMTNDSLESFIEYIT